jgi:hypothetical protein
MTSSAVASKVRLPRVVFMASNYPIEVLHRG